MVMAVMGESPKLFGIFLDGRSMKKLCVFMVRFVLFCSLSLPSLDSFGSWKCFFLQKVLNNSFYTFCWWM